MRTIENDKGRFYVIDESKKIYLPSVTTVIGAMSDKSGLDKWIQRVGKEEADRVSIFSANRGSYMHMLHEKYIENKFINEIANPLEISISQASSELSNLTEAELECGYKLFNQFIEKSDFYDRVKTVIFQESPVWTVKGGGVAGRLDLYITDKSDENTLIDFKTSKKPKRDDWIMNYKLQTSCYAVSSYERFGIIPKKVQIWISCETGEVQMFELNIEEIKYYFNRFITRYVKPYHDEYGR